MAEMCPIHADVTMVVRPTNSVNGGSIRWGCAVCNMQEIDRLRGLVSHEERLESVRRFRLRDGVTGNS